MVANRWSTSFGVLKRMGNSPPSQFIFMKWHLVIWFFSKKVGKVHDSTVSVEDLERPLTVECPQLPVVEW